MRVVEGIVEGSSRALAVAGGTCVVLMMLHVVLDCTTRYAMNLPLEGTLEIVSQYYMVAVVFPPLALVQLRGDQVRADMFLRLMPRKAAVVANVLTSLLSALFFLALAYYTGGAAAYSTKVREVMMGTSYIAVWPSKWIVPVGFFAVGLAVVFQLVRTLLNLGTFGPRRPGVSSAESGTD